MLKVIQFCYFKELQEKSVFLEIAAQGFEKKMLKLFKEKLNFFEILDRVPLKY